MIVCTRERLWDGWADIQESLNKKFNRCFVLKPFQPDKAMFYCEDRNDAEFFEWNKIIALGDGLTVCTQSWNRAPVAMNKKLSFTRGWLCIEDLPLKWWTREVFELIGKRCGGLLEYDKRTTIMSQIFSAKIRARGNSSGFIPAEIDVCIEEDNFTVKLKVISKLNLSKRYRQTVNSARHDCKRHRIVVAGSEEGEKAVELNDQEISNDEDLSVQRSVEKGEANAMNKVLTSRSKKINHNSNAMLVNVDNIFSALRKDLGDNGPAGLNHLKSPVKLMEGQTKEYCLKPKRFKSGEIRSNINNNLLVYRRKENKEAVILNYEEEAHVTRTEGEEEGDTDDNGEDESEDYAKIEGNEHIEVGEEGDEMQGDDDLKAETEHGIEEEGLEGVKIFGKPALLNTSEEVGEEEDEMQGDDDLMDAFNQITGIEKGMQIEDEAIEEYSIEAEIENGIEVEGLEGVNIFGEPTLLNTVQDTQILEVELSKFTTTSPVSSKRFPNQSVGNILPTSPSPSNLNLQGVNPHNLCTTEKSYERVIKSQLPYTPVNENQYLSRLNTCQVEMNNQQPMPLIEQNGGEYTAKNYKLSPIQPDKAVFWCDDECEAENLAKKGILEVSGRLSFKMQSGDQAQAVTIKKLSCTGGWIEISDLPLKWWNMEVFKAIGYECGGLVEIDHKTLNFEQIFSAKIKIGGKDSGFILAQIDMSIGEEEFMIGLRVLSNLNLQNRTSYKFPPFLGEFNRCKVYLRDDSKVMCSSEQQTVNVAGIDGGLEEKFYTMKRENNEGSSKSVVFDDGVGIRENHGKGKMVARCNEGVGQVRGGEVNLVGSNGRNEFFDGGNEQLPGLYTRQRKVIEERYVHGADDVVLGQKYKENRCLLKVRWAPQKFSQFYQRRKAKKGISLKACCVQEEENDEAIIKKWEEGLAEREGRQEEGESEYEDLMSDRAEEGAISENGLQLENFSESEEDDYGDDYNSEEDNCGAVSFYHDKGGGWLASFFSEHQIRMSVGVSKIIINPALSQGWQIIARRGRFSVLELAVSVCYDGGVMLRGCTCSL
ncbi:hypothetical protein LguiB_013054 [Lonicera macranthoides]